MTHPLFVIETFQDLKLFVKQQKRTGKTIGLVPTMGSLHAGHLSLVDIIAPSVDYIIVSIFVNPLQFGQNEDLAAYPRDIDKDLSLLSDLASSARIIVYTPEIQSLYPAGFQTEIRVKNLNHTLEAVHRPGHFEGVATVVAKLILQTQADKAIFGEKDFQQLAVIRQMVTDLNIDCTIIAGPLVRDQDGMALSSRNAYLSSGERRIGARFNEILSDLVKAALALYHSDVTHDDHSRTDNNDVRALEASAGQKLLEAGFNEVDYISIIDPQTLHPLDTMKLPARIVSTVRIRHVRLLDTMEIS